MKKITFSILKNEINISGDGPFLGFRCAKFKKKCHSNIIGSIEDDDYSDIARHGIVEVVGDDVAGRKIIVISACRLPSNKNFDYAR